MDAIRFMLVFVLSVACGVRGRSSCNSVAWTDNMHIFIYTHICIYTLRDLETQ